jgi:TonB family protein
METLSELAVTFLVNALWQISALLIIALVGARLILRNASARRQYLFWVAVFILSVGLPIFSIFTFLDNSKFIFRLPFENNRPTIEKNAGTFDVTAEAFAAQPEERTGFDLSLILQALSICYFLFLAYRLFRLLRTWQRTARLRHSVKNENLPPLINTVAERCCTALQINAVPILFSAETAAPITFGAGKPIIILPEKFTGITSEKTLTAVLGHELTHIRRRDYGWNLFYEFLSLPVSFHPAVAIMKRNINQTREMACDELVAECLLNPLDYARSLVQIAGFISPSSHNAITLGVFNADILEKRIMKMIETSRGVYKGAGKIRFLLAVTLLGITAIVTTAFSVGLPIGQAQETEKITIPQLNSAAQEKDSNIINGGVINGKAVSLPKPEYPDEAKKANVGGTVTVKVIIDEEGNVTSADIVSGTRKVYNTDETGTIAEIEEAPEKKLLYESAEKAAKQAKFAPTLLSGKPVRVKGIIVYNFVAGIDADDKTILGDVLNGKAISLPLPAFSAAAKAVAASGTVVVQVTIDEEGNIISPQVISGHPLLRQSAVKAAKEAKFAPAFLNGQPVKVSGVLVYNFAP